MTPTVLKIWKRVCAFRGVINRLGGAASKRDIAADLHERGYAYTIDQIADLLASAYFKLRPDHLRRALDTGPVMTPTRRKIAERWLAILPRSQHRAPPVRLPVRRSPARTGCSGLGL